MRRSKGKARASDWCFKSRFAHSRSSQSFLLSLPLWENDSPVSSISWGGRDSMKIAAMSKPAARRGPVPAIALLFIIGIGCAQSPKTSTLPPSSGALRHYDIKVSDLPAPEVLEGPRNQSKVIPRPDGAELTLPPGFQASVFAEDNLQQPRHMVLASNGDVFVSEPQGNRISIMRDSNNDGRVDERFVFATGLNRPF